MAPPAGVPRPRLTLKGVERKKPGPKPRPLWERLKNKPPKPVKRLERRYTRQRKIEVLLYLINHRIEDPRLRFRRQRVGQPNGHTGSDTPRFLNEHNQSVYYRAPTYAEASEFWNIPTQTIQRWWEHRERMLKAAGIELPQGNEPSTDAGSTPGDWARPTNGGDVPMSDRASLPVTNVSSLPDTSEPQPRPPEAVASTPQTRTSTAAAALASPAINRPPAPIPRAGPIDVNPVQVVWKCADYQPAPKHQAPKPVVRDLPHETPRLPAAWDPANYVILYVGPLPGPEPGQHCLHRGAILPVAYPGQPVDVPPMSYAAVYPSGPPPGWQDPRPRPDATRNGPPARSAPHAPPHPPSHQLPPASSRPHQPNARLPSQGQPHDPNALPNSAPTTPYIPPPASNWYASCYARSSSATQRQEPHSQRSSAAAQNRAPAQPAPQHPPPAAPSGLPQPSQSHPAPTPSGADQQPSVNVTAGPPAPPAVSSRTDGVVSTETVKLAETVTRLQGLTAPAPIQPATSPEGRAAATLKEHTATPTDSSEGESAATSGATSPDESDRFATPMEDDADPVAGNAEGTAADGQETVRRGRSPDSLFGSAVSTPAL